MAGQTTDSGRFEAPPAPATRRRLAITLAALTFLIALASCPLRSAHAEFPAALVEGEASEEDVFAVFQARHERPLGPHYSEFSRAQRTPEEYDANRHLGPNGMAAVLQNEYGRGSMLGRSALGVASLADLAERGSQLPLDTVNLFTGEVIGRTCKALKVGWVPDLRLRSRVRTNGVAVGIRTRW